MRDLTGLERVDLVVRGERSELHVRDGTITLRKEAATQQSPTEITFDVDQVRAVTLKAAHRGERGWLHVAVVGGSPPPPSELAATGDPYTLPLGARGSGAAKKLARLVDRHVQARGKPADTQQRGHMSSVSLTPAGESSSGPPSREQDRSPAEPPATADELGGVGEAATGDGTVARHAAAEELVEQLRELADLHEAGALTDDEFAQAKARILR